MDIEVRWSPEATEDVEAIAELSCTGRGLRNSVGFA